MGPGVTAGPVLTAQGRAECGEGRYQERRRAGSLHLTCELQVRFTPTTLSGER